jgi:hypothetical protein
VVAGVMEGANACVLAYGQSGTGKAHTLAGTPQQPGINFRAMSQLFRYARTNLAPPPHPGGRNGVFRIMFSFGCVCCALRHGVFVARSGEPM